VALVCPENRATAIAAAPDPGTAGAPRPWLGEPEGRENGPAPRTLTPTGAGPLLFGSRSGGFARNEQEILISSERSVIPTGYAREAEETIVRQHPLGASTLPGRVFAMLNAEDHPLLRDRTGLP